MVPILTQYLTQNPCYKNKRTIKVEGLMLHSVGCPQPNPDAFVRNWNRPSHDSSCVHGFVGNDKIVITLPCMEKTETSRPGYAHRAWHCGKGKHGSFNNSMIGIEMTEPGNIKYVGGATFTCTDKAKAIEFVRKNTQNAVELFARLCIYHHLDPLGKNVIVSHKEGSVLGKASGHSDPSHLWDQLGMNYDMNKFRKDVYNKIQELKSNKNEEDDDMDAKKFSELMTQYRATLRDNDCSAYSADARKWAVDNGLISGNGKAVNGEPNMMWADFLSREQFVTVLHRFAKMIGKA